MGIYLYDIEAKEKLMFVQNTLMLALKKQVEIKSNVLKEQIQMLQDTELKL